jgi:hypothetical protein
MIFRQLIHDDLGCASYLIGDEAAGVPRVGAAARLRRAAGGADLDDEAVVRRRVLVRGQGALQAA